MQADAMTAAPGPMGAPQDTTTMTVTPFIPPSNGQYMKAGYLVTVAIYLAYTISLFVRARAEGRGR